MTQPSPAPAQDTRIRAIFMTTKENPDYRGRMDLHFNGSFVTCDPDGSNIRNILYQSFGADAKHDGLADLELSAFSVNYESDGFHLIGQCTEYRDVFSVDFARAHLMAKTLTRLNVMLEKRIEIDGRPESFGAYVARVAQALGATAILFESPYGTNEYQVLSTGAGASKINHLFATWAAKQTAAGVAQ